MADTKPNIPAVEPQYDPSRPMPKTELLYQYPIQAVPGKTVVSIRITLPPNAATPPHTHPSSFVTVYVTSGYILNKMNNEQMKVYGVGDTFKENLGCHHKICENLSQTEEAVFYATIIVDTEVLEQVGAEGLFSIDEEYKEVVAKAHGNA